LLLCDRWVDAAEAAPLPADERPRLLTLPVGPAGGAVVRVWSAGRLEYVAYVNRFTSESLFNRARERIS
jgi:hypothetical protein